jgi:hypothetical protein
LTGRRQLTLAHISTAAHEFERWATRALLCLHDPLSFGPGSQVNPEAGMGLLGVAGRLAGIHVKEDDAKEDLAISELLERLGLIQRKSLEIAAELEKMQRQIRRAVAEYRGRQNDAKGGTRIA